MLKFALSNIKNKVIMKTMEFTAVYNTDSMKGVEYSFEAINDAKAIQFCAWKFSAKDILLVNHTTGEFIHLGDKEETERLLNAYKAETRSHVNIDIK